MSPAAGGRNDGRRQPEAGVRQKNFRRKRRAFSPGKILIIGTLGSGKTTLARCLARETGFPYASIDECRTRFGDGTVSGEDRAWDNFLGFCGMPAAGILEFSGMGPHADEVREHLCRSSMPVYVIWLVLPPDTCVSRAMQRHKNIPFPFPLAPVEYAVPAIHESVQHAWDFLWSREPCFHVTRLEFPGTISAAEIYAVVRKICFRG